MGALKADGQAKLCFAPGVYEKVPKSTFALIAYYLARMAAGNEDRETHEGAMAILRAEVAALESNGRLTDSQARTAERAFGVDA